MKKLMMILCSFVVMPSLIFANQSLPRVEKGLPSERAAVVTGVESPQALPSGSVVFERTLNLNGDDGPFSDFNQQIADSFSLSGDANVTGATFYGNFLGQGDPLNVGDTWDIRVRIFNDAGGVPEALPIMEADLSATVEQELAPQSGDTIYLFAASFSGVDLDAGETYFLSILSFTQSSFRWSNGTPTDAGLALRSGEAGSWSNVQDALRISQAFALYAGEVVEPVESEPVPGLGRWSMLFLVLAMLGLVAWRRTHLT